MPNIGMPEMIVVLAIALLVFGPKKLPSLGKAIGQSIKEFKDGMKGLGQAMEGEDPNGSPSTKAGTETKSAAASTEPVAASTATAAETSQPAVAPSTEGPVSHS
ncbi:MAG: twin-arginine translocase TatA/TatE family subunit [Candidatus Sumerlaeota bacterium]|nr:twin-arginine translocase TatA/TatE family subunit [Candidatus Sumerlaeota bacterium]